MAYVEIDSNRSFTPLPLGDSGQVPLNEPVIAIGYPLAEELGLEPTVSRGIISAKRDDYLQTDASLNPGSNGSVPLAPRPPSQPYYAEDSVPQEVAMSNVVLVVDMLKGFLEPGHNLYHEESRRIIPHAQRLVAQEKAAGSHILFLSDHHDPDDLEFRVFPVHCVIGTEETQVIPELAEFVTADNVIPKKRYSGFFNTDLSQRLGRLEPDKLLVCGVATNICVLHTTSDARNRDYEVEVYSDCVSGPDPEAHRWALQHCRQILGAKVI